MASRVGGAEVEHKDRLLVRRWMETERPPLPPDRLIDGLQVTRFYGGLLIGTVIKAPLLSSGQVTLGVWAVDSGLRLLIAPAALAATSLVVVVVYALAARRGLGNQLGRRLRGPAVALGAFFGHVLLTVASVAAILWASNARSDHSLNGAVIVPILVVATYAAARGFGFVLFAIPALSRHMFRTVELHPALPAVITVVFVWTLVLQDLFFPVADWPVQATLLSAGGALAATGIALIELHRLRSRHNVRLRTVFTAPGDDTGPTGGS
ncbi:hypothetical protein [Streptomyces sp. NPDC050145]|uniref:hypothetical protein n=1 Tax=Streptomyces sp. NPDC050145 TaxID=3365602 RepID=UPI0037AF7D69